ncbi:hypothetical protein CMT42_15255 [Elizabethkingia anophelis]|uniref:Uncharacterized protein n=1 Tax=Elizabethkingia anophelis TaxID=1117645 RepID=A0A494J427_9FLAO|nr:hypothetical protein [Elizabethkingia anophelis]AQX52565.1 hypothetical protein AYC66_18585 [Elizabethkingia anophelis]MDV3704768.1 hypothetical protein [Elizabethkingia anophelis]MDV3917925.1 hypothetical protein [Elizabethkingia anophelis]MDV3920636.1 hypothetical protein [Elizabethkingia anophelis]MDV3934999.1 hypothetical protein [Elizabethkingia anophelis]
MKKIIVLFFISIFSLFFGQKAKTIVKKNTAKINCFLPNGEKCPQEKLGQNMYETNINFEPKRRTWFSYPKEGRYKNVFVVFKSLTKDPLYVHPYKGEEYTPEEIKEIINETDYSYYFGDYYKGYPPSGLYMDIEKFINEKTLIDSFVLDTLGSPSDYGESYTKGRSTKYYYYSQYKVKIWFVNGLAVGYDRTK